MPDHSKEPWTIGTIGERHLLLRDRGGGIILIASRSARADLEHIVACVNYYYRRAYMPDFTKEPENATNP